MGERIPTQSAVGGSAAQANNDYAGPATHRQLHRNWGRLLSTCGETNQVLQTNDKTVIKRVATDSWPSSWYEF